MKSLKRRGEIVRMKLFLAALVIFGSVTLKAADHLDTESELPLRYGYLVIDTIVGRATTNWRLNQSLKFVNLPLGRRTKLIRLPVGNYQWQHIDLPHFDLPHRVDLTDDVRWSFTIKQRQINYVGTLIVNETRGSDSANVRFVNRSSDIVDRLNTQFPMQISRYGLTFSGSYRDDYFLLHNKVIDSDLID